MTDTTFLIEPLKELSPETAERIRQLAQQLGKNFKPLSDEEVKEIVTSPSTTLFVARESKTNQIVGMLTLLVVRIPYARKATLEDIIVDENFREHGIGTKLIYQAIAVAKEQHVAYIDFTSRPRRAAGNNLYEKMGFQQRDTNVYRLLLDYEEV